VTVAQPSTDARDRRLAAGLSLVLVAAVGVVYLQVRDHAYVDYDDLLYIANNPNVREGLSLEGLRRAFLERFDTNWIPLTAVSYLIEYSLHGAQARYVLLANAALHALSSVGLLWVVRRATGATWLAAFVAAIFALHPLHVESVAWASERKDVLSGLCWIAAMGAYVRYCESLRGGWYLATAVAMALGGLAKPMVVTLPFALLLLDLWPLRRLRDDGGPGWPDTGAFARALVEKLPLLALSVAFSAVTISVQGEGGAMRFGEAFSLEVRLANALHSYVVYVAKTFWPLDLAAFYPHPAAGVGTGRALAALLVLAGATAACLRWLGTRPHLAVGWLWFLGTLVPVIGLVQVGMQARADRYMYLPMIGLSLGIAWEARDRLTRLGLPGAARIGLGTVVLLALAVVAHRQVGTWKDTVTLFEHAVAVTEDNAVAHSYLAEALVEAGRGDEALPHFQQAIALDAGLLDARLGVADALLQSGRVEEAIFQYRMELAGHPGSARAHGSLGIALLRTGQFEEAGEHLETALRMLGEGPEVATETALVRVGLGTLAERRGDPATAIAHYEAALARVPGSLEAANNLAWLLATTADERHRDPGRALALAERAAAASADNPAVLDTLAAAQAASGRFDEAVATAERALATAPPPLAGVLRERLAGYREGRAHREAP